MNHFTTASRSIGQFVRNLELRLTRRLKPLSRNQTQRRQLRAEPLEARQLMAGDFVALRHNEVDAEDVNGDGQVVASDALIVINAMRRNNQPDVTMFTDVNQDGLRNALDALRVINRISHDQRFGRRPTQPTLVTEFRSIDGTGNNLANPEQGSTNESLLRVADADYSDGVSAPAGTDRPSAREISNLLSAEDGVDTRNDRGLSAFLYVWGQFLDHDIDLTQAQVDGESFAIEVPSGDALFDPTVSGAASIPLTRSQFVSTTGTSTDNPRQQVSSITAYIDGSQVYGSDQTTADSLRTFSGGKLIVNDDGLLLSDGEGGVKAGDIRAGENISLTAIQTLFVREHNRLATSIAAKNTRLSDEQIYQQARAIVIAEIQAITYNEFLPALLGQRALAPYRGYNSSVNPTIANEFSTAAFRFGHSTLNDDIGFFDNNGRDVRYEIELADAFFNAALLSETGIDSILKYEASSQAQEIDLEVVDGLRNFLFGPPGAGGFDLVALNIQRGRDHGLSDYNSTRVAYGLDAAASFDEITSDVELQAKLATLYGDVDNIDLWVGLLAEDHVPGASVGELTRTIIADQFQRLRDGDRFWYENVFKGQELIQLQRTSLSDLIEANTTVKGLQQNVFYMLAEVSGQVTTELASSRPVAVAQSSNRRGRVDPQTARPVAATGVTVELLDNEGNVIDTMLTDRSGNYRFRSFAETGDYQIRLAATGETLDLLISNGITRIGGLDFRLLT